MGATASWRCLVACLVLAPVPASWAEGDVRCVEGAHWANVTPAYWTPEGYEACEAARLINTEKRVCSEVVRYLIKNGTRIVVHGALKDKPSLVMMTPMEGPNAGKWGIIGADDVHNCVPKPLPVPKGKPITRASCRADCEKFKEDEQVHHACLTSCNVYH